MTKGLIAFFLWHATGIFLYAFEYWHPTALALLIDVAISLAWARYVCRVQRAV